MQAETMATQAAPDKRRIDGMPLKSPRYKKTARTPDVGDLYSR
jgi:hypothetical protein